MAVRVQPNYNFFYTHAICQVDIVSERVCVCVFCAIIHLSLSIYLSLCEDAPLTNLFLYRHLSFFIYLSFSL